MDKKKIIKSLSSENPDERRSMVESLLNEELGEDLIKILSNYLNDENKGVRDALSTTLSFNGDKHIPHYIAPYISSPNIAVRNLAGEILLKIGVQAITAICDYLKTCDNPDDIKFLIDIIGLIGDEKPVDCILKFLEKSENENVILSCIEALGNLKSDRAVSKLIEYYEKNELYKATIIEALGKMNARDTLAFLLNKYQNEDDYTKIVILESLGSLGDEKVFYFLLSELQKVKGQLLYSAVSSIRNIKDKYNLEIPFDENTRRAIMTVLIEADVEYKINAASLLSIFNDAELINSFVAVYGEDQRLDEIIKPKLFENIDLFAPKFSNYLQNLPKNLRNLLQIIKEIIDDDKDRTLGLLSELENRNLSDALSKYFEHPDEEVRRLSAELIFQVNQETGLLFLETILDDDNIWNKMKFVEILENIYNERASEGLKILAQDEEEMISERARNVLSQRGGGKN